jgi:cyclopropane fatty-acyl-phospholipid synthase-like methyltransferase
VVGFSNSRTQKEYIESEARRKGFKNVEILTGDVKDYEFQPEHFDRVVSIEVSSIQIQIPPYWITKGCFEAV